MDKRKALRIPAEEIELVRQAVAEHGGQRQAAKALGKPWAWVQRRVRATDRTDEPVVHGRIGTTPRAEYEVPSAGRVYRYIFTCAQNNTRLHDATWDNLNALAGHYDARILVSTFTYNKAAYGKKSIKAGSQKASDADDLWYDPRVTPHICDVSIQVAPGLVWCGEMNILPTAVRPLSGLESYTGRKSGIFPHVKFALDSVASGKTEGTKFNYTTGTVTQRNYIAKKTGLKAEFHHGYGGLLVEVDSDGAWWCRQLNADSEGTIYDLTLRAKNGKVTDGHRIEAVTWGDIHEDTLEPGAVAARWGSRGMIDVLRPKYQFMHDILDFRSRNHHDRGNPHKAFEKYIEGKDDVLAEVKGAARFLARTSHRNFCHTVVVNSNHDNAMTRWLREADYRTDPPNALFFLEAQLEVYRSIADKQKRFMLLEWALRKLGVGKDVEFLRPDESFVICHDANGGIECGMHGHEGPNGARGSVHAFAKMGRKSNTGHGHAAAIEDGAYRAGVVGALDQGYNGGPSSWSHSDIITYPNGKRAIITMWSGKWRP